MLVFKSWEIKTKRINGDQTIELKIPELPFRHLEKNMLYLTKHIVLGVVLVSAKYWFILSTKFKKWFDEKWPKINAYFKKNTDKVTSYRHSFVKKAILESKVKIKRIREKVKEEMSTEEKVEE
jgi:TRAP-type C4-dicarboxylate transport system substrate-binding protein